MDHTAAVNLVTAYADAMRDHDVDRIMEFYAATARVEDPVGTTPHIGSEAIRAFYTLALNNDIDMQITGSVRCAAHTIAFPFRATIGQERVIEGIDVFDLDSDNKIIHMKAIFGPANVHSAGRLTD